jgi:PPK2 family polyphosphate:nucleotide phosphotransferase
MRTRRGHFNQLASLPPMLDETIIDLFRVDPGEKFRIKDFDTAWVGTKEMRDLGEDKLKERAQALLEENRRELAEAQELLWASDTYSLLVIFQAIDAAGKDGTIKHVMSGVNPQGVQVHSFKKPSDEELDHTFLWRCMVRLPERGRIGIFNRSYYEEVLVVRVHQELLAQQRLPQQKFGQSFWDARYEDINNFEHHLHRNGTVVLKFFLNVSKREQKKRFLARIDDPKKHWKFNAGDVAERSHWDQYMEAYEDAINATNTKWAPWYVIPADHKWVARTLVAEFLSNTIGKLDLKYPEVTPDAKRAIEESLRKLEAEP